MDVHLSEGDSSSEPIHSWMLSRYLRSSEFDEIIDGIQPCHGGHPKEESHGLQILDIEVLEIQVKIKYLSFPE